MKKVLSLILCVLMVIGSFAGAITVSAEETNLWTDISVDDFGTKDTNACPISGYEEGTNNYGKKFTVKGAYYTSFYIEMPELEPNSVYDLSFKYDNYIIASTAGSIRSVYVATEEDLAGITDVDGTKLPSTATLIGSSLELDKGEYTELSATFETGETATTHYLYFVTNYAYWFYLCDFKLTKIPAYDVAVDGGTADKTSAKEGDTVTLTATPTETQLFDHWEIVSGNVEISDVFSTTATFTMPAEAVSVKAVYIENLWSGIDTTWLGTFDTTPNGNFGFSKRDDSTFADAISVDMCWYTSFYVKLPSNLKTSTAYNLTFNYNNSKQTTSSTLRYVYLATEEDLANLKDDGTGVASTARILGSSIPLDQQKWTEMSVDFTTADTETQYYLYFVTEYAYRVYLGGFSITEIPLYDVTVDGGTADKATAKAGDTVTLTATPTETQEFSYWEVVSGNVSISDATNEVTTFTMPTEAVSVKAVYTENLWGAIDTTWFGTVDTTLNDGFGFTDYTNDTYDDAIAVNKCWYSTFYIKLPSNLKTNTDYELTFNYDNSIQTGKTSTITRIDIVTEEGLENADSEGYGTTIFKNLTTNLALDRGGWTEFTADFTTGDSETEYYLYFTNGYCYTLRLGGFEFKEITKNPITVENGTANVATAKEGTEITVAADAPAEGMIFDHWEVQSGDVTLADPYSATTTFTMGSEAVSLKATYTEYGAKIVYVNTDGSAYADAANLNHATIQTVENADGTCTDTLSYDVMDGINTFLGWYSDETLLEDGLSYTYNPDEVNISEVTAKILCRNVLTGAAGFESYENGTSMRVEPVATGVAPYADKWGLVVSSNYETENIGFYLKTMGETSTTYYTDIGYDRETGTYYPESDRKTAKYTATPHSGDSMLALSSSYRSFVRKIEGLKPNTSYTMSMYVMNPDEYNFLSSVVVASTYNIKPSYLSVMSNRFVTNSKKIAGTDIYGFYEEPRTEELFETNVTVRDKSSVQNWKKISFTFKTDDNTDSIYMHLYPRNRNSWYNRCQTYIDDMVCYENAIDYEGNAMRTTSAELPQALRYKFSVKNEMLTSYEGYTFKELGILAVDNNKLNGAQLYKGNEAAKDVTVTENNYQYVDGDTENTYFTAALYNIGRTNGSIDYSKFATEYAVRPYFVYTDEGGKETVVYGNTETVSIFDVMYAIRDWPKSTEDLEVVNSILENAAIKNAYSAWQPDDGWNIDNPNAPTEYDYSFAIIGDVQYTTENYPEYLPYIYDWLIDNKEGKKLEYVFGMGDITNMSTDREYTDIDAQLQRLKDAGINQTVIRGNHDAIAGYDKYITADKYAYGGESFESYDGTMKTYYRIITIGNIKYMMLTLDFFPSTDEVAWAREKVDANPDCNVIITTHGYLDEDMTLLQEDEVYDVEDRVDSEGNALGGHAGQYIYDNLVLPCSNVVMVLCGHECSYGPETKLLTREDGTTAIQVLTDFQQPEYTDLRSYGMISMFYFGDGGKTVTVEWFSSVKNEYYMDKYQYTFDLNVIK